jgi:hypothetical protein
MSAELKRLADVLKFANDHRNDIEEEKYPSYEEMQKALEQTAPEGWIVSDEYHFIGVNHPSLTNEQFISFGDVNGYFGFNDTNADTVCGYMEGITDPAEIAKSFWDQLKEFYPELFVKKITVEEIIKWHEEQAREALASNEEDQWLMHLSISAKLAVSFNTYPLMNKEKN